MFRKSALSSHSQISFDAALQVVSMKPTGRLKQATLQGTNKDKISGKASDGMERDGYRGSSLLCRRSKGAFRDGEA